MSELTGDYGLAGSVPLSRIVGRGDMPRPSSRSEQIAAAERRVEELQAEQGIAAEAADAALYEWACDRRDPEAFNSKREACAELRRIEDELTKAEGRLEALR